MRIVVGSAFRNCAPGALLHLEQVAALRDLVTPYPVRVIAVEGDSIDTTRAALQLGAQRHGLELDLVTCNHGGPPFGSTEAPERLAALSKVGNAIFDAVRETDDALLYVESDLRWTADTARRLLNAAVNLNGYDVIAPLVMAGPAFYDIWGFRGLDGRRFSPFVPYYPGLDGQPFEIGSAGSCLAMRGAVARTCRIRNNYGLVGWCEDARAQGYRIAVYPALQVYQL
jgi:hypothetical protein